MCQVDKEKKTTKAIVLSNSAFVLSNKSCLELAVKKHPIIPLTYAQLRLK